MPNSKAIRKRMREINLSQKEAALKMKMAQSTLSLKINGRRPFFLSEAERFASILSIPDEQFRFYFF